jgi:hypothetical protein
MVQSPSSPPGAADSSPDLRPPGAHRAPPSARLTARRLLTVVTALAVPPSPPRHSSPTG